MGFLKSLGKIGKGLIGGAGKVLGGLGGVAGGLGIPIPGLGQIFGPELAGKLPGIAGGLGNILSGGLGISQAFGDTGISPSEEGRRAGKAHRAFLEEAYPGTNPWERLGTGQAGGQAQIASDERKLKDRMNDKTLSTQRDIARQNAMAAVGPAVIKENPNAASEVFEAVQKGGGSIGPNAQGALSERQFGLESKVRNIEAAAKAADADANQMNALTNRMRQMLESDKFNFEAAVKQAEVVLKDEAAARDYARLMLEAYDKFGSNLWRMFRSGAESLAGEAGGSTTLQPVLDALSQPRRPAAIPGRPHRSRSPTSVPGRTR